MNRNVIKFIAAFTMTLDHIGVYFFAPTETESFYSLDYIILRVIGRVAFILFAYMIAEGFIKTSNLKNYFLRLFVFAVGIEVFIIGYSIVVKDYSNIMHINVIWPLVFGLGALSLLKSDKIWIRLLSIPIVFLAEYINTPYGAYGVLIIMIFALYRNKLTQFLFVVGINLLFIQWPIYDLSHLYGYARYQDFMVIQWFSLLAFIFIYFYNGKKGRLNTKWFFYIFYPMHLGLIYLVSYLI